MAIAATAWLASVLLGAMPFPSVTVDLDGDGTPETAVLVGSGSRLRLEIHDPSGGTLAKSLVPAPLPAGDLRLTTGSVGSAGSLIELAAAGGGAVCRSVWRFQPGRLTRLPLSSRGTTAPDCADADWSYRWVQITPDVPSLYVRERTRETPAGAHHELQIYRFTGFELTLDEKLSKSEIRGIAIPGWARQLLYPQPALESLYRRYDLSRVRSEPRLTILADQAQGTFDLRFRGGEGREHVLPVCGVAPGTSPNESVLTAESGSETARAVIRMSADGTLPVEAVVLGLGPTLDRLYRAVLRQEGRAMRAFPTAEDELAIDELLGSWSSEKGEMVAVGLVSAFPALLKFGSSELFVRMEGAPDGVDVLLVPNDGSAPAYGLVLRGPDRLARVPVTCDAGSPNHRGCRRSGAPELFRRVGSRVNGG